MKIRMTMEEDDDAANEDGGRGETSDLCKSAISTIL